jgi:hypothetical protein
MKLRHLIWLIPALCSCNSTTEPVKESDPLPKELKLLSWLGKADIDRDTTGAIQNKDFRLLAIAGRGMAIPGIEPEEQVKAKQLCKLRYMTGMGDVIVNEEHRAWWKKAQDYAAKYNQVMAGFCFRQ